jgi:hypothetical protein
VGSDPKSEPVIEPPIFNPLLLFCGSLEKISPYLDLTNLSNI